MNNYSGLTILPLIYSNKENFIKTGLFTAIFIALGSSVGLIHFWVKRIGNSVNWQAVEQNYNEKHKEKKEINRIYNECQTRVPRTHHWHLSVRVYKVSESVSYPRSSSQAAFVSRWFVSVKL